MELESYLEFHANSTAGQVCTVYLQGSGQSWLLGQNVGGALIGGIVFRFSRGQLPGSAVWRSNLRNTNIVAPHVNYTWAHMHVYNTHYMFSCLSLAVRNGRVS